MNIHFSSKTDDWATPQVFFDELNKEFKFNLDVCASNKNAKCKKFFTEKDNGLSKSWDKSRVFMNPPYGREIGKWVKKASEARGGSWFVYYQRAQIQNTSTNIFTTIRGPPLDL